MLVCVLCYGDHFNLIERCVSSIRESTRYPGVSQLRIGMNAVTPDVRNYLIEEAREFNIPVLLFAESNNENVGKYPLMRQMLRYANPQQQHVMWFDDDSFLDQSIGVPWWDTVLVSSLQVTQLGAVHHIRQQALQQTVIHQQPWYTGKLVNAQHWFQFATGGWWVADSAFLQKWDYPFPALYHNGGDSILGELIRQQSGMLVHFTPHIRCHCESCAAKPVLEDMPVVHINVGGRKGRRGIGVTQEKYVWADGCAQPSLAHQNFELEIRRYEV